MIYRPIGTILQDMSNEQDRSRGNMFKSYVYSVGGLLAVEGIVKHDYLTNKGIIDELRQKSELTLALIENHLPTILYIEGGMLSRVLVAGVIGLVSFIASEKHSIKKK